MAHGGEAGLTGPGAVGRSAGDRVGQLFEVSARDWSIERVGHHQNHGCR